MTVHGKFTLSLSSFWTLRFTRRSMNGFNIICSLRSWCSFNLLPLFSPAAAFSMSFENHSLNSSWESNKLGIIKWRSAQSSVINIRAVFWELLHVNHLAYYSVWVFPWEVNDSYSGTPVEFSIAHLKNFLYFAPRLKSCIAILLFESIADLAWPELIE